MEYTFQEMPDLRKTGERKVYPKVTHSTQIDSNDFMAEVSDTGPMNVGTLKGAVEEITRTMVSYMSLGHSVKVDGLGTFSLALGMKEGHASESVREDGARYDTNGVYIRSVNFIPDADWLRRIQREVELHKVGDVRELNRSVPSADQRLATLRAVLDKRPFVTVRDYAALVQMSHSSALKELNALAADPASGIGTSGSGSHKVFVRR